jgi:hypothetical protein
MLRQRHPFGAYFLLGGIFVIGYVAMPSTPSANLQAADAQAADAQAADAQGTSGGAAPVEDDMHEFMEYLFQPPYKRLKVSMAAAPTDNAGWKGIKSDSLILAEGGNLLLSHTPSENGDVWNEMSMSVRDTGKKMYQAGKSKDFASARTHYELLLKKCNACHDKFADGEHQLMP